MDMTVTIVVTLKILRDGNIEFEFEMPPPNPPASVIEDASNERLASRSEDHNLELGTSLLSPGLALPVPD